MKRQKFFAWLISILSVVVVVLLSYLLVAEDAGQTVPDDLGGETSSTIDSELVDLIDDWQTYKDPSGMLAVNYPLNWRTADVPDTEESDHDNLSVFGFVPVSLRAALEDAGISNPNQALLVFRIYREPAGIDQYLKDRYKDDQHFTFTPPSRQLYSDQAIRRIRTTSGGSTWEYEHYLWELQDMVVDAYFLVEEVRKNEFGAVVARQNNNVYREQVQWIIQNITWMIPVEQGDTDRAL